MKKIAYSLTASLILGSGVAFAGPAPAPKNPVMPEAAPCYMAGEVVVKPFFNVVIFDDLGDRHYDDDTFYGGGLAVDYYITDKIAIGLEGSWIDTDSVVHGYNVNLTYRLTCPTNCLSAYIIGGGGVYTNGETVGAAHIGGGVEYRFTDTLSAFADGRYSWLDGGDVTLTSVRIGLGVKL